jgi:hypothetical protein
MPRPLGPRPTHAVGPVLVDASAWLALVSSSDGRHAEAELAFAELRRQKVPLLTTKLVLAEVQRLLLFRVGSHAGRRFLNGVSNAPSLTLCFQPFQGREHVGPSAPYPTLWD